MNRARLNYWIDIALLISFLIVGFTGLVLYFAFVSNTPHVGKFVTFMGTHKSDWLPWHEYAGLAMVALVVVHLILHFRWLVVMTRSLFDGKKG